MADKLLILGGTGEARRLASLITERFEGRIDVVTSLAGRTRETAAIAGRIRRGGFGGARGLADFLTSEPIRWVIDATHPFAAVMSQNTYDACTITDTPRLMLVRPPYEMPQGVRWMEVADFQAAAENLAKVSKVAFLAVGRGGADAFADVSGVHLVVRMIEMPEDSLSLDDYTVVTGRPPFTVEDECRLFETHRIDTLVARNAGGDQGTAKFEAAKQCGVRVILIARPPLEPGLIVDTPERAVQWIGEQLA